MNTKKNGINNAWKLASSCPLRDTSLYIRYNDDNPNNRIKINQLTMIL